MQQTYKHSYKTSKKQLSSLSVYNVGYQKCESGYKWGPAMRDHYLIHHIIEGCGYYVVNNRIFELHKGDTFIIYPFVEIMYYADTEEPWEYTWVGFAGSDVPPILRSTDFTEEMPVMHQGDMSQQIRAQISNIYEAKGNEFADTVEMTGCLYQLLAYFMKSAKKKPEKQDLRIGYVQKACEYIGSNYSYPITVEDVADYVGISRSYLFRAFSEYLQESPKDYLTSVRIQHACLLLEQSSMSITSIAKSVGYEDGLYFSKAFKKIKGVSPSEYKKQ